MAGLGTGARYGVHADNLKNMARGIAERVLYVVRDGRLSKPPQPIQGVFGRLSSLRERLVKSAPPTPVVDVEDYPLLYVGRKRAIYRRAADSLKIRGVSKVDSYCSTFLKAEKINFTQKPDPAPRVIQPRSPRYNVMVGRYLKLFEKRAFAAMQRMCRYPVVLKGMNAQQVGGWLATHWDQFRAPAAVGLDASRFDQHVSVDALRFEHSIYNAVFKCPDLARLLRWQLHNRGIARTQGVRVDYTTEGCRMSGDINTGLGNCILMSLMVLSYCEHVGIKHRLANNGDDCVLFVETVDLPRLVGLDQWMLDFGFTLTREDPVFVLERVVFCQAQPVYTSTGWRMVRDPRTAMSKDCVSLLSWDNPTSIKQWCHSISSCGLSLTRGVPVWEEWYNILSRGAAGVDMGGTDGPSSGMAYMAQGVVGGSVTDEARVSFWRAFDVLPDQQEHLEAEYRQTSVGLTVSPMTFTDVSTLDRYHNPLATWLSRCTH